MSSGQLSQWISGSLQLREAEYEKLYTDPGPVHPGQRPARVGIEFNTLHGPVRLRPRKLQSRDPRSRVDHFYEVYKSDFGGSSKSSATRPTLQRSKSAAAIPKSTSAGPGDYDTSCKLAAFSKPLQRVVPKETRPHDRFETLYANAQTTRDDYDTHQIEQEQQKAKWNAPSAAMRTSRFQERLQLAPQQDTASSATAAQQTDVEFAGERWSDFVARGGTSSCFLSVVERFSSPPQVPGPGTYESEQMIENAKKAIQWARTTAQSLQEGERFPSPQLGSAPGQFETQEEVDQAKRAIMWSRQAAQVAAMHTSPALFEKYCSNFVDLEYELKQFFGPGLEDAKNFSTLVPERFKAPTTHDAQSADNGQAVDESTQRPLSSVLSGVRRFFVDAAHESDCIGNEQPKFESSFRPAPTLQSRLMFPGITDIDDLNLHTTTPAPEHGSASFQDLNRFGLGEIDERDFETPRPSLMISTGAGIAAAPPRQLDTTSTAANLPEWYRGLGEVELQPSFVRETAHDFERLKFVSPEGVDFLYENLVQQIDAGNPQQLRAQQLRDMFPSPDERMGTYATPEELEYARKAINWVRLQATSHTKNQRFPAPAIGLGPGEYQSEVEVENAKREILWSHLRSRIGNAELSRIEWPVLPHNNLAFVYNAMVTSDFSGKDASIDWNRVCRDLPSPKLSWGCFSIEEIPDARRAIYWARQQAIAAIMPSSNSQPSVQYSLVGPGDYHIDEQFAALAIEASRAQSQIANSKYVRLQLLKSGNDSQFESMIGLSEFAGELDKTLDHERLRSHFPSPEIDHRMYSTEEELNQARHAVRWARIQAANQKLDVRFPELLSTLGPGEFGSKEDVERARNDILWSRLTAASRANFVTTRLKFPGNYSDVATTAESTQPLGGSNRLNETEPRFPSPRLATAEFGEMPASDFNSDVPFSVQHPEPERFPSLSLGIGPGEYEPTEVRELATKVSSWQRWNRLLHAPIADRASFFKQTEVVDAYDLLTSDFILQDLKGGVQFASAEARFPSPVLGNGPGEYASQEEVEAAKIAVGWIRDQAAVRSAIERFPEPPPHLDEAFAHLPQNFALNAIVWSAVSGLRQAFGGNLPTIVDGGAVHKDAFLAEKAAAASSRLRDKEPRFSDPDSAKIGPGEYTTLEELDDVKRAMEWAHKLPAMANIEQQGINIEDDVFGSLDPNSSEFDADQVARRWSRLAAIMRNRLQAPDISDTEMAGLLHPPTDPGGPSATFHDPQTRFEEPQSTVGPGDYASAQDHSAAKDMMQWTRRLPNVLDATERFVDPVVGPGPGEGVSASDIDAAHNLLGWSRVLAQSGQPQDTRLTFEMPPTLNVDGESFPSAFSTEPTFASQPFRQAVARFDEHPQTMGPGEYSIDPPAQLLHAPLSQALPPGDTSQSDLGPGTYSSETEIELARRTLSWLRSTAIRNNIPPERLVFRKIEGADESYFDGLSQQDLALVGSRLLMLNALTARDLFPSPTLGPGFGEYTTPEELELAKNAVKWARAQAEMLTPLERFPEPAVGVGPGDFTSEAEVDAARKAIMWSRLCSTVPFGFVPNGSRLNFHDPNPTFDTAALAEFGAVGVGNTMRFDAAERFPSPRLGLGPGEYTSQEELEMATKAVHWARQQFVRSVVTGDRFPDPSSAGDFDFNPNDVDAIKQAIMWSKVRGQVDKFERLLFAVSEGAEPEYDQALLTDFENAIDWARLTAAVLDATERFPTPPETMGPGDYEPEFHEFVKRAIVWTRACNKSATERFVDPPQAPAPGIYLLENELEFAHKVMEWKRLAGMIPSAADDGRLKFETLDGPRWMSDPHSMEQSMDLAQHPVYVSVRERFPSPTLGLGVGEYATSTELEDAKRAVDWARTRFDPETPTRFPSPTGYDNPSGSYMTAEELEQAKRMISWSRRLGERNLMNSRLNFEQLSYDTWMDHEQPPLFDEASWNFMSPGFTSNSERFQEHQQTAGPGEFFSVTDIDQARAEMRWARAAMQADATVPPRFADVAETVGPGDYLSEAQLEDESKERYWARLRALEEIERYYSTGGRSDWWE